MTAADYKVTFPYGATSAPYSASHPHRGDDRACPANTAVVIGNTTIGLTGSTGKSDGPHLHIQEWQKYYATTRKPQNAFKGGRVIEAGYAADFGYFITIQCDDGWNNTYAHLNKINVAIGQQIGDDMVTPEEVDLGFQAAFNERADAEDINALAGKTTKELLLHLLKFSVDHRTKAAQFDTVSKALQASYGEIETLRARVKDLENNPKVVYTHDLETTENIKTIKEIVIQIRDKVLALFNK